MFRNAQFFLFFCCFCVTSFAQIYTDASVNLPNAAVMRQSMDVQAADLDNDGDLDIVLANEFQANTLLLNDGQAVFTNGTIGHLPQPIHDSEDVAIADYNLDGFLDLAFCSEDDLVHELYLNDGTATFTAGVQLPNSKANALIVGDLNGDHIPDLLFGNDGQNSVFINQGDATFINETSLRLPINNNTTQDLYLADVTGDGYSDLIEGNEDGNRLHINQGNGIFMDETNSRLPPGLNIETRKIAVGDMDGDGDLDMALANVEFISGKNRQNRLFRNDGTGVFEDITSTHLPSDNDHSVDVIFEDVDLDQDLDMVVANVFGTPMRVYTNDGTGHFTDATLAVFGTFYFRDALGVIAADLNGDNFKDLYICDRNTGTSNKDLLLLRMPPISSTVSMGQAENVQIFPNPHQGQFQILLSDTTEKVEFRLTDVTGKIEGDYEIEAIGVGQYHFKLGEKLQNVTGIHFLNIKVGEQVIVKKIVFEK